MQKNNHYLIGRVWFFLNLFASLYPLLYWEVGSSRELVLGLPIAFVYFISISISITFSILYAYWEESCREGWK